MTGPDRSMFDVPVDALYVWIGVAAVSVAVFGVTVALPTTAPPDATAAASAVDAVALGPIGSRATHAIRAGRIRLGTFRIGLAGSAGRSHATYASGPVTPVVEDRRLERVLRGGRPANQFDSGGAYASALAAARSSDPRWRPAPDRLTISRVSWRGVNATLVG